MKKLLIFGILFVIMLVGVYGYSCGSYYAAVDDGQDTGQAAATAQLSGGQDLTCNNIQGTAFEGLSDIPSSVRISEGGAISTNGADITSMLSELDDEALNIQGTATIHGSIVNIGGTVTVDGNDVVLAQDSFIEFEDGLELQGGIVDFSAGTITLEDFGTYTDDRLGLAVAKNAEINYKTGSISVLEGGTVSYIDTEGSAVVVNGYGGGVGVDCASAGSCTVNTVNQDIILTDFGQDVNVFFDDVGRMEIGFGADGGRVVLPPYGDVYFTESDTGNAEFMYVDNTGKQILNFDVDPKLDTTVQITGDRIAINDIQIINTEHHSGDGGVSHTLDSTNTFRVYRDGGVNIEGEFDGELVLSSPSGGGTEAVLASGEDIYYSNVDDETYLGFGSLGEGSRFADATLTYADGYGSVSVDSHGSMSMNGQFKIETDDGIELALGNPGSASNFDSVANIDRTEDGSLAMIDLETGSAEYDGRLVEGNSLVMNFEDGILRTAEVTDGMCTVSDDVGNELLHAEFSDETQLVYFPGSLSNVNDMETSSAVYIDGDGDYIVGVDAGRMSIDNGGSIQIVENGDVRTGKGRGYSSFVVQPDDVMSVFLEDDDTEVTAFVSMLEGMDDDQRDVAAAFMGGYQDAMSGRTDADTATQAYEDVFAAVEDDEFMAAYLALDEEGRQDVVKLAVMENEVYADEGYTMADAMVGAIADHEFYSSVDIDSAWTSNNPLEGRSVAYGSREATYLGDAVAALDDAGNINDNELAALMYPSKFPEAEAQRVALKFDGVPYSSDTVLGLNSPTLPDEMDDAVAGVQNMDEFRDTMVEIFGDPELLGMGNDDIYTMIAEDNGWDNLPRDQLEKRVDNGMEGKGIFAKQVQSSRDEIVLAGAGAYGLQQDLDAALEQADQVLPPESYESGLRAPPDPELGTISDVQGIMGAVNGQDLDLVAPSREQLPVDLTSLFDQNVDKIIELVNQGEIGEAGLRAQDLSLMLDAYSDIISDDQKKQIMDQLPAVASAGYN